MRRTALALLVAAGPALAGGFLGLGATARGFALGACGTGLGIPAYNPAGLALETSPVLAAGHSVWFAGANYDHFTYSYPLGPGTSAVALRGLYLAGLEGRTDSAAVPGWRFGVYSGDLGVSYAMRPLPALSLGLGVIGVFDQIDQYRAFGAALNAGVLYLPIPSRLSIGAALLNIGPDPVLNTQKLLMPREARLGASFVTWPGGPVVAADVAWHRTTLGFHAGVEYSPAEFLVFRLGYRGETQDAAGPAFGLGLALAGLRLDYGVSLYNRLGFVHQLGLTYAFGPSRMSRVEQELLVKIRLLGQTFYNDGITALAQGDYENARANLEKALVWDPENADAEAKYREAESKWRESSAQRHLQRARQLRSTRDLVNAVAEYEQALRLKPDWPDVRIELASTHSELARAIGTHGTQPRFEKGLAAFARGEYRQALLEWQAILQSDPTAVEVRNLVDVATRRIAARVDTLLGQAADYVAAERYPAARAALEEARTLDPNHEIVQAHIQELRSRQVRQVSVHMHTGIQFYNQGRLADAEKEFQAVLTIDPENKDADRYLKKVTSSKGVTREELLSKNMSATLAFINGDYETAIRLWEEILTVDPGFTAARRNLERARLKLGEVRKR